ncbi:AAA-like domain-containing protein [Crocosphaera sp.]|uniref:AAA-like domain-containing protein n=1 Tax=Crocosphaera sp. TaxID=2729996 RepID=UPI003F212F3B|nr:AAA-like domain-containing protein [Crocosphaera sp.]
MKKILLLSANPFKTTRLRVDEEMHEIREGLRRSKQRENFVIETAQAVRYRDISRAILDHEPNIVHFSGHGEGEQGLIFEDETGQPKLVKADALARLFELFADEIECVVLNACYSEVQAKAIAEHIPYVVGMNKAIADQAAIEFAVGFYDGLGAGKSVKFAYQLGCNSIEIAGIPERLTPQLLSNVEAIETQNNNYTTSSALDIWKERLNEFQKQEAIAADPAVLFQLKKQIEACQEKIEELEQQEGKISFKKKQSDHYIERSPIEQRCYQELLTNGALIRVKAAEKMGKTLLLEQLASFAQQQNYKTVYLNLFQPENSILDESSQFLRWLCKRVSRKLKLPDEVDEFWGDLSPNTDCTDYFEDYILDELTTPLVLQLDNIEQIFTKNSAFDFFSMIRSWWGMRHKESWKNLRLILSYSTEALPKLPIHQSPFNVGLEIKLPEFNQEQVMKLITSHNLHWEPENIDKLMIMVSGHPYLISEGINYLVNYPDSKLDDILEKAHTEEGLYAAYLQHHWSILEQDKELSDTLRQIVESEQAIAISPKYSYILEKMGLICQEGNQVKPRCQMYRLYFQERLKTLTW